MPIVTRLFRSNRTQAVRLPKDVAFPRDGEVVIAVEGESRVITPVDAAWGRWFDLADALAGSFPDREQPPAQERDWP